MYIEGTMNFEINQTIFLCNNTFYLIFILEQINAYKAGFASRPYIYNVADSYVEKCFCDVFSRRRLDEMGFLFPM